MNRKKWRGNSAWAFALAALALLAPAAWADTACSFNAVVGVNFGTYSVLATSANDNGVGSLRIKCQGGGAPSFVVGLSTGQSFSYVTRVLKSGTNSLNYNLYTNSTRSLIWGDGSGGSSTRAVARNTTTTLSVFGRIAAGQDAAVGIYVDSIVATVNF